MKINKFHKSLSINSQNYTKYNMKLFIILRCNKNLKGGNKMSQSEELVLIPKYEKYMQYIVVIPYTFAMFHHFLYIQTCIVHALAF